MNKNLINWRFHKIRRRLRFLIYSRIYRNPNKSIANSILIAGTGRSGTTWLADIISSAVDGRILFEPFYSRLVQDYSQFHYFQYMRPDETNQSLEIFCGKVFSGTIRHPWIDRQVAYLNASYRVIKAIRANLFLKWIHIHFPELPIVFIIRHPCAVVLSRMRLDWATDDDIDPFLAQPKLVGDFLDPFMDIIQRANTNVEKHAVIWCVSNLIPLVQFKDDKLNVLYYEHLCTKPEYELPQLFAKINRPYQVDLSLISKPSTTSRPSSAILTGDDRLENWCNKLSAEQVDSILKIVDAFGLGYLYGENILPKSDTLFLRK